VKKSSGTPSLPGSSSSGSSETSEEDEGSDDDLSSVAGTETTETTLVDRNENELQVCVTCICVHVCVCVCVCACMYSMYVCMYCTMLGLLGIRLLRAAAMMSHELRGSVSKATPVNTVT
jgi:hypothetical protein